MKKIAAAFLAGLLHFSAFAQPTAGPKHYTLFHPVPRINLREMQPDRPDVTESPFTVDAGHFQFETDLFKHTYAPSNGAGPATIENVINSSNFKLGITEKTDLQVIVDTYAETFSKGFQKLKSTASFPSVTIRIKQNFFGNDGGKLAMGLIPYASFSTTGSSEGNERGVIFPVGIDLGNDWSLGTELKAARIQLTGNDQITTGEQSVTVAKGFTEKMEAFSELANAYDFNAHSLQVSFNAGLIFSVSKNVKFDAGFYWGVTKETDRTYFTGFSFRY